MEPLPPRSAVTVALAAFAALGGAMYGTSEAARVVVGGGLWLGDAAVIALLAVGALSGAAVSAVAALPLALLPRRPLGRARWMGLLWGLWVPIVATVAIAWFTDPPPFTDPFTYQGNAGVFALVALGLLAPFALLYQGARGARAVAGAATTLAVAHGVWVYSASRGGPAPTQPLPAGAPSVLLVTIDTARADRFGAYGNERVDTRHFDALAAEGALALDAVGVAPVTGPSHMSMLTGAGPWDHGVLLNGTPVPTALPTLAELLRDHGWQTAAFVSAYVLDGGLGFRRGFDVYDDDFGWLKGGGRLWPARLLSMLRRHADPDELLERRGGDTVDAALSWTKGRRGAYFLWVHLFDPHGPYDPPPPFDTAYYTGDPSDPAHTSMARASGWPAYLDESLRGVTDLDWVLAQYDGEISYTDRQLGRLLEGIDRENTLVVVTGDHGESFGEHGVWFEHVDVHEAALHVPFAMRWPGKVPAGARLETPVEGSDVAPTVLGLVGVAPPATMTGRSLFGEGRAVARSLCFDRAANKAARAAGEIDKPKWRTAGLRGPSSRYVLHERDGAAAYFDLATDPAGETDVSASVAATPEGVELLGILKPQAQALFGGTTVERDVSDEERERLKALGYLEE